MAREYDGLKRQMGEMIREGIERSETVKGLQKSVTQLQSDVSRLRDQIKNLEKQSKKEAPPQTSGPGTNG